MNKEGLNEFIGGVKVKEFSKNTLLLEDHSYETTLRFLSKGVVREFYRAEEKQININFYTKPQFITDFSSFMEEGTTNKNQETLSAVEILELGKEKLS